MVITVIINEAVELINTMQVLLNKSEKLEKENMKKFYDDVTAIAPGVVKGVFKTIALDDSKIKIMEVPDNCPICKSEGCIRCVGLAFGCGCSCGRGCGLLADCALCHSRHTSHVFAFTGRKCSSATKTATRSA